MTDPAAPSTNERRLKRFLNIVTASVSLIIAIAFPAIYFASGYRFEARQAEHHATMIANTVSEIATIAPEYWRFQTERIVDMAGLLHRNAPHYMPRHGVVLYDRSGAVVLRIGMSDPGLTLSRASRIEDGVSTSGLVEVRVSLRRLIGEVLAVACFGALASLILFYMFWRFPRLTLRPLLSEIECYRLRLERTNADLQGFVYLISHDLRSPLQTVKLFAELLHRRYGQALDERGEEMHGFIVKGIGRIEAQLGGLREYATLYRDTALETQDTAELVNAVLADMEADVVAVGARVDVGPLPTVPAVPLQLRTLVQNLIGNALKYRHPDRAPEIRITATVEGAYWHLTVADNGIGIAPENNTRIFDIFSRLHPADTHSGVGIGLALCKRVTDNHGGRIWVASESDVGSTFHVMLPTTPMAGMGHAAG